MDNHLEHIKKHMNVCVTHLMENISVSELYEYKMYIKGEEALLPFLRTDISFPLEMLRQRVEALTYLMEAEERRLEEEYIHEKETKK